MPVQLSYEEGLPETAVMARKRPFMMAVVIVSHYFFFFMPAHSVKPEVKFYAEFITIQQSTGHVQKLKKKNPTNWHMQFIKSCIVCVNGR